MFGRGSCAKTPGYEYAIRSKGEQCERRETGKNEPADDAALGLYHVGKSKSVADTATTLYSVLVRHRPFSMLQIEMLKLRRRGPRSDPTPRVTEKCPGRSLCPAGNMLVFDRAVAAPKPGVLFQACFAARSLTSIDSLWSHYEDRLFSVKTAAVLIHAVFHHFIIEPTDAQSNDR